MDAVKDDLKTKVLTPEIVCDEIGDWFTIRHVCSILIAKLIW
jgi:hypothetical protein